MASPMDGSKLDRDILGISLEGEREEVIPEFRLTKTLLERTEGCKQDVVDWQRRGGREIVRDVGQMIDKKDVTAEIGDKVVEKSQQLREVVHGGMSLQLQGLGKDRGRERESRKLWFWRLFIRACCC